MAEELGEAQEAGLGTGLSRYLEVKGDSIATDANIGGSVIVNYMTAGQEQLTFAELTTEFPENIKVALPPTPTELEHWIQTIEDENILILSSHSTNVVTSAGHALVSASAFRDSQRRMLSFGSGDKRVDGAFEGVLQGTGKESKSIVLVDGQYSEAGPFVQSLIRPFQFARAQVSLRKIKRKLVVLTTESQLREGGGWEAELAKSLPYRYIDYLRPLLAEQGLPGLLNRLEKLRASESTWGAVGEAFYKTFTTYLGHGCLVEELDKIERGDDNSARPESAGDRPLLDPKKPIETVTLFAAAFFDGLSVEEFQRVIFGLLGDRIERTLCELDLPSKAGTSNDDDEPQAVYHEKSLRDIWMEDHLEILDRCRIEFYRRPFGRHPQGVQVDFRSPSDRGRFQRDFLGRYRIVHLDLFRRACNSGFLFDDSHAVSSAMLELILVMAESDRDGYGHAWLMEMIRVAGPRPGTEIVVEDDGVRAVFVTVDSPRRVLIMNRLVRLASRMLATPGLNKVVDGVLTQLVGRKLFREALEMAQRLQYVAGFDTMYWLRQLFDRGDAKARHQVGEATVKILGQQLERGEAGPLLQLASWLPEGHREINRYSSDFALRVIIDTCGTFVFSARWQKPIHWPPDDPMIRALAADVEGAEDTIVSWLFHRGNDNLLQSRLRAHVALLTESWLIPGDVRLHLSDGGAELRGQHEANWQQLIDEQAAAMEALELDRGHYLFQAIVLADWAVLLIADEKTGLPEAAGRAFNRLSKGVRKHLERAHRQILSRYLGALESSLATTTQSLESSRPKSDRDIAPARTLRSRLKAERRSIRRFRQALTTGRATVEQGRGGGR